MRHGDTGVGPGTWSFRARGDVAVLLGGTACSVDLDRAQGLDTTLAGVDGADEAVVLSATRDTANRIEVTLDLGLDPTEALATVKWVDAAARDAASSEAKGVAGNSIRVRDALLGEVTYEFGPGNEAIQVVSGGGIAHDIAEVSRIGSGGTGTTWRFVSDTSASTGGPPPSDRSRPLP